MRPVIITLFAFAVSIAIVALQSIGLIPVPDASDWDLVATVFWSIVPFMLCLFLGVLTRFLVGAGPALASVWPTLKVELEARAAMHDAIMWQARHAAKAQRKAL